MLTCRICGHKWISRLEQIPRVCPRCKRYEWNEQNCNKIQARVPEQLTEAQINTAKELVRLQNEKNE